MHFKFLFILFIILSGCQKPYDRECWKSNGKYQITQIQQSSINEINLYDDINLILINDSLDYLSIESPKNLTNGIKIEKNENFINIRNTNKCDFLRKHVNISIEYHYTTIDKVNLFGYGKLTNNNAIKHPLIVQAYEAISTIDLNLENSISKFFIFNGSTSVKLSGICNDLYFFNSGLGPINGKNIQPQKLHINSSTVASSEISVGDTLIAEIRSNGDLYYIGTPTVSYITITGEGKLIQL